MKGMLACLLLAVPQTGPPPIDFDVRSGGGLTVSAAGVPLVRGSWFQYYEPDWSRGYYSSNWSEQQVRRESADRMRMTFKSPDGRAHGSQLFEREGDRLRVTYQFHWEGERPVHVELATGMLWAPALEHGELQVDGVQARSLRHSTYEGPGIAARAYGPPASRFAFRAPLGEIDVTTSSPVTIFDGRGYGQEWSLNRDLIWMGPLNLRVERGQPTELVVEWRVRPERVPAPEASRASLAATATTGALAPRTQLPVLAPSPKQVQLDWERTVPLSGAFEFPAGKTRHFEIFEKGLARRFRQPAPTPNAPRVRFDAGETKLGIAPGGYRITITPQGVSVLGEEEEGVRNGMERLAQLAFVKDGRLVLPTGNLVDWPSTEWRGVHLFTGPTAVDFHGKLWERVLRPMGFNKVVLQCERTDWQSVPGIATDITISRADLVRLNEQYRRMGVEVIPLIQSWGHMGWIFVNGRNRDIAFNQEVLFSVDPSHPRTREVLSALWAEAVQLLRPKTIHFGLDEVDMRGGPDDPELVTTKWESHLPWLGDLAKKHRVNMMLWGDKALAPGEAPDAAHGHAKDHARRRRDAIPRGSFIADWHYKADERPHTFLPVLQLWKREGFRPIASAWFRPENVMGFNAAAVQEGVGTLQTTWAGYESAERHMLNALHQFSAMILAAEYSWGGHQTPSKDLPYDPMDLLRKMYFGQPEPVRAVGGAFLGGREGLPLRIGSAVFRPFERPIVLQSSVLPGQQSSIREARVEFDRRATELVLAIDAQVAGDEGEHAADLVITFADGTTRTEAMRYGHHFRAFGDTKPVTYGERSEGRVALRIPLGGAKVLRSVTIRQLNPYVGIRLHAATTVD
jgi:hypothetical protein